MLLPLALFTIFSIVLVKSASMLVGSLVKIGRFFKLSDFVVSFILMAAATSLPELFVSVTSAVNGTPQLALGTVLGSNIADLTLVAGLSAVIARGIRVKSVLKKKDGLYMGAVCIVLILLMLDRELSRFDGGILLFLFALYYGRLFAQMKQPDEEENGVQKVALLRNVGMFLLSAVLLIVSAEVIVKSATSIAAQFSLPLILIGLVLVALGTSLPELAFEISAITKNHRDMVMGDILGSVVANSSLILGITALISPIDTSNLFLVESSLFALLVVIAVFLFFLKSDKELSLVEGVMLVIVYVVYVASQNFIEKVMGS